ncbi:response regulator [Skermanella mucosa]|uniref:response regulator n=1 Tax=Skermanella mucosa TaxID=1789672 RepID=UPI00192C9691|nr:response regulator [Skermanella mucosa]UEM19095.1 response regulator [Skermanella mucosa]
MPFTGDIATSKEHAGARRILVCEDNHLIAMGLASILTREGYTVLGPVDTGEEALRTAFQDLPDLVLLDIGLASAVDGISVAAELHPMGVSIIFVTSDYQRAALDGREYASDVLIKPVRVSAVLNSVAATLAKRPPQEKRKAALAAS